jgi:hypothetical protein
LADRRQQLRPHRDPLFGIKARMNVRRKPIHETCGSEDETENEYVVNDSMGTVDPADSTGNDEDKETGDAKWLNANTRED